MGQWAPPFCRFISGLLVGRMNKWAANRSRDFSAERVAGYYGISNENTEKITGLNLTVYGCDCSAGDPFTGVERDKPELLCDRHPIASVLKETDVPETS